MGEKPPIDARWHHDREARLMAEADGWCMVRHPGCMPYTIFAKEWRSLPTVAEGREMSERYRRAMQRMIP